MGVLRRAESGVEKAFFRVFGRKAGMDVTPVELARKLVKEMEEGRVTASSSVYVPHVYSVYLCPRDWARYESHTDSLTRQLESYLVQHARRERYRMLFAPTVTLMCDPDLEPGQFGISTAPATGSAPADGGHGGQELPAAELAGPAGAAPGPAGAAPRLTLRQGRRAREFTASRVLLGRAAEADFQIEDPNVSRRHAVLFWDQGRLYLRDLGSTNGTLLNGKVVNSAMVHAGDVIRLGTSELTVEFG